MSVSASGIAPISSSSAAAESSARSAKTDAARAILREPLLHFIVLGAALFALDYLMIRDAEDPSVIAVGSEVDTEAARIFEASRGRAPNAEERAALRQVWLDNEVLYREGLAMRLDGVAVG